MKKRDIVVIGASAGGIEVLLNIVKLLPENFDAAFFVVLHMPANHKSALDKILGKVSPLKVVFASDGEAFHKGVIYLAPPDFHLLIENGRMLVKKGPKENRFRPSIDALFRSAAYNYGEQVIGIVLSGLLNDGTSGLWSIKQRGGIAIVQNPSEALFMEMPQSVLEHVDVDHVISVRDLPKVLEKAIKEPTPVVELNEHQKELMGKEVMIASQNNAFEMGILEMGELSPFTCPECHGTLVSIQEGNYTRFRCHTGHAFSSAALLAEVTKTVEESLWNTLRGLEETVMLLETKGKEYEEGGDRKTAAEFYKKADQVRDQTHTIRSAISEHEQLSEEEMAEKERKEDQKKSA